MEDAIREARRAFTAALRRGDAAAAALHYADDGRLLVPGARLLAGRRQIEAYWLEGIACGLKGVELRAAELRFDHGIAVEIGEYVLALDGGGAEPADRGAYLVLHRQETDGAWRRAVDVFNPKEDR